MMHQDAHMRAYTCNQIRRKKCGSNCFLRNPVQCSTWQSNNEKKTEFQLKKEIK